MKIQRIIILCIPKPFPTCNIACILLEETSMAAMSIPLSASAVIIYSNIFLPLLLCCKSLNLCTLSNLYKDAYGSCSNSRVTVPLLNTPPPGYYLSICLSKALPP